MGDNINQSVSKISSQNTTLYRSYRRKKVAKGVVKFASGGAATVGTILIAAKIISLLVLKSFVYFTLFGTSFTGLPFTALIYATISLAVIAYGLRKKNPHIAITNTEPQDRSKILQHDFITFLKRDLSNKRVMISLIMKLLAFVISIALIGLGIAGIIPFVFFLHAIFIVSISLIMLLSFFCGVYSHMNQNRLKSSFR